MEPDCPWRTMISGVLPVDLEISFDFISFFFFFFSKIGFVELRSNCC